MIQTNTGQSTLAQAFEEPQSAPQPSSSKDATWSEQHTEIHTPSASPVQFPPSKPHCFKCQPSLHHSHSTVGVPTTPSSDSTALVTPAHHVSVRRYLGPLPVPASAARAIARAILEDSSYADAAANQEPEEKQPATTDEDQPAQPNLHDVEATDHAALPAAQQIAGLKSPSRPWSDPFRSRNPSEKQNTDSQPSSSPTASPKKSAGLLPRRPRTVDRDPSSTSVLSNASFVSANSMPRDALSDSEAPPRGRTVLDGHLHASTDASSSASRSISPAKKRFRLLSRKSNQSFPGTVTVGSFQPPASILKPVTPTTPFACSNTDANGDKKFGNIRSAENLRVAALRQERRVGSEGSKLSASVPSSPNALPIPLPILDLPLNDIEEAMNSPSSPDQPQQAGTSSAKQQSSEPNGSERRLLNSSNDTTIIRADNENSHDTRSSYLRHQSSFDTDTETNALAPLQGDPTNPHREDLLHPSWEQSASAAGNASTSLADAPSDNNPDDAPQNAVKAARAGVGRGLPTKRSLTFSRDASSALPSRNITGPSSHGLPRATDHNREFSRQSRMSRASTAGTLNTVGTVVTDGSFGATAGAGSSLARKFLTRANSRKAPKRNVLTRNRSLRDQKAPTSTGYVTDAVSSSSPASNRTRKISSPFAVRRRRTAARSTSFASTIRDSSRRISASGTETSLAGGSSARALGVPPGAVGTSAGGTKWVGESFQIGQRFWNILDARRYELRKSQPCTCGSRSAAAAESENRSRAVDSVAQKEAEEHAAKVEHLKQSPDGVITLLAQEAQDVSDEKASEAQGSVAIESERHAETEEVFQPDVAAVETPGTSESGPSHLTVPKDDITGSSQRKLTQQPSFASIQTIHPDESVPVPIEARQGWSEIVSKMSSLTGELGIGLKARTFDRKSSPSSLRHLDATKDNEKQAPVEDFETAITHVAPNVSVTSPTDPDLKIVARSSSLVGSEKSSAASKSVYASVHPNGIAPRASSLTSGVARTMTRSDALTHSAPPASVEAKNPKLVHQLLRRKSDLGERPDVINDAASDYAVVVQPVTSPVHLTPTHELSAAQSLHLREQDPFPFDPTPPDETGHQDGADVCNFPPSNLRKPEGLEESPDRRKTVKFDTASARNSSIFKGRFAHSLFAGKAERRKASGSTYGASSGDTRPRPPEEVLSRPQPNVIQTHSPSDGTTPSTEVSETSIITRKSVLKKDRMLVKLAWTQDEDLPKNFDELQARKFAIREENWREYIVVFRMGKLELWSDPSFRNKLQGHSDRLTLKHTIALSRSTTFLSLYSPIDRIFCLTYQPWKALAHHQGIRGIHLRRQGTDIALFDCRAHSTAADWMWELWRELGNLIPDSLEVHVPSFGLKVKIPVPETMPVERAETATPGSQVSSQQGGFFPLSSIGESRDAGEGFKLINRHNIISMTWKLFQSIPQWQDLMKLSQERGLTLELAWRRGTELDWVISERTVENEPRHWAVLCGALLRDYKNPAILELRAAIHYPTSVQIGSGQFMAEPPAVEGFLWRVKPVSGALTRLYFTTYDGHLYVCRTSRAFPPDRHLASQLREAGDMRVPRTSSATQGRQAHHSTPASRSAFKKSLAKFVGANQKARRDEDVATLRQNVLEAISHPAETEEEFQAQIEAYQSFERRRQFEQIRGSDGFIDLKLIHTIKTVGRGPARCPGEDDVRKPARGSVAVPKDGNASPRQEQESDENDIFAKSDIGGQEGLEAAEDANELRQARQIELTLTNGKKFMVEAFSAPIAREWVERISDLVVYWRRRERADAIELMYAAGIDVSEMAKHVSGNKARSTAIDGVDDDKLSPLLGNLWNWCAIEGCRNIIKSGKLFRKSSSYGAFKARNYVLIAGRLLCFKLVRSVNTARARQNNGIFHRRQALVIHLRDAYVYSGKLSEDMLKNGRSDPAQAVSGIGGGGSNSGKRHRVPRVYADGLFSVDDDEDCTFVIRYRPERVNTPANPGVSSAGTHQSKTDPHNATTTDTAAVQNVPSLEDKAHKYIAMRARSKTERDLWVRCISYEIEKIVREDLEREKKLKNIGRVDHKK